MTLPAYANNQQSFPAMYERHLVGPLFQPWAEVLLDTVRPAAGERVLDIACGTGIVARLARQRVGDHGVTVGVDVSAGMLEVARSVAPAISWREGSALDLPLVEGEQFDVVTCQQGLQFFPDRPAAARQMRRALAAGGRLVVATWRGVEESPFFERLLHVGERHVGPIVDQRHAFGDGEALGALLTAAGIAEVAVTTVSKVLRFADGMAFARLNAMALVGMSKAAGTMDEAARAAAAAAIAADSVPVVAAFSDGGGLAFDLPSNVATGRG
ncbi:MAG: class I SAM-dependent methyltransferase [Vicinamibacterales bacterium]